MDAPAPTTPPELQAALTTEGPLSRETALALLRHGDELMAAGEFARAGQAYSRVSGFDDPTITAAAWLGLGDAYYRLDRESNAVAAWEAVLRLPDTRSTYRAWRNVAAARVRDGDLSGAIQAYREADRRAPAEDKAEIASRLGWLAKETGNAGAARRYFARSRGDGPAVPIAYLTIAITVIVSFVAMSSPAPGQEGVACGHVVPGVNQIFATLELDKACLAAGEWYRLWSVTLVHAGIVHLLFNMYALYLIGPLVEGIWGSGLFVVFYLLTAAAASVASFVVNPVSAVGASGAIFGLVGVLMSGTRAHHPVLDRRARAIVPQLGTIVLINLAFGFFAGGFVDNSAHIGGLISGLWLGLVVPPGKVPTLRSMWQRPGSVVGAASSQTTSPLIVVAGVVALIAVILVGLSLGGATFL